METQPNGDTSNEPKELKKFCIRHVNYVAEVRRKDWKKCCPFRLPAGDSAESNYQAERVLSSLLFEDNDALVNYPQHTEAQNCVITGNDSISTIPLERASSEAVYADCPIKKIVHGDTVAAENDKLQDVVVISDSDDDITNGASNSSSSKLNDDVQYQNKNSISKDTIDAGNENDTSESGTNIDTTDSETDNDTTDSETDKDTTNFETDKYICDEERNLEGGKPQKYRLLSDILKELSGPSDALSSRNGDIEFTSETEDDSDQDFTLETVDRKRKGVRVITKSGAKSKNEKRISESFDQARRMKPISEKSSGKDTKLGSKHQLRKTRTVETEDDSDHDFTLETVVRKRRAARDTFKSGVESKNKKRISEVLRPSFNRAKKMKPMSENSSGKDPKRRSKRQLKKTRRETDDDSDDDFTLETVVKNNKGVRVISSGIECNNEERFLEVLEASVDRAEKMKPMSENSSSKELKLRSKCQLRKIRTGGDEDEDEDDSDDDFTLQPYVRKKRGVRVIAKSGVECTNEERISEVLKASVDRAEKMNPMSENSSGKDPKRHFKRQLRKTRTSEIEDEDEDDSDDDFTLQPLVRKNRGVRVIAKSGIESTNEERISEVLKASVDRAKVMKPVSENSSGEFPKRRSKRQLRKTRTIEDEDEDDSDDDFTLQPVVRKKRGVRLIAKSGIESKDEERISEVLKASVDQDEKMNPMSENSSGENPKPRSKRRLRKTRTSEIEDEDEDDSDDDFTLQTVVRKKKCVRVIAKSGTESKNEKRISEVPKESIDWGKRMKLVSENSCDKYPQTGSARELRKSSAEVDLRMMNKAKNCSAETTRGGGENTPGSQEDSLYGNQGNRDVWNLVDGSQMCFSEENNSRSQNGVKSAQLVHPTIGTSNNINTASGCVQKSISESYPRIDKESMAALQLLRLVNAGVNTQTSSKTATKDTVSSLSKGKISYGLDETVPPASGSLVCQSPVEVNMINGATLPQDEQTVSETSVCHMFMNPSEFSTLKAKKFMRRDRFQRKRRKRKV